MARPSPRVATTTVGLLAIGLCFLVMIGTVSAAARDGNSLLPSYFILPFTLTFTLTFTLPSPYPYLNPTDLP